MKVRIRKTDTLFRKLILKRDKFTCQRCGRVYPEDDCRGLHVSHYFGRGRENVRHDPENCIALCYPCHQFHWGHGDERDEYSAFMRARLGDKGFQLLELRAYTYKKRDDLLDEVILKELLKDYE